MCSGEMFKFVIRVALLRGGGVVGVRWVETGVVGSSFIVGGGVEGLSSLGSNISFTSSSLSLEGVGDGALAIGGVVG